MTLFLWFAEIQEKLVPAETGIFKLRDDIAEKCDAQVPNSVGLGIPYVAGHGKNLPCQSIAARTQAM